ncbi:MAG: Bug family tripartite tricarboxylate transporter substrate binding protein [bacterium]|nr:hypothetical protein [Betaproteobacteria bacterium]
MVRANPDGYALLPGYAPEVAFNKLPFSKVTCDRIADLTPIALTATAPLVLAHISSGKLRAIAVAGPTRDPLLPDAPTTVELGIQRLQIANWFGLFGPKGMAPALVSRLATDTGRALPDPGVSKSLLDQGLTPSDLTGPKLRAFIADEMKRYAGFYKETGITADQ